MRFFWLLLIAIPVIATSYSIPELMDHAIENDTSLKADREIIQQLLTQKEVTKLWENPELMFSYGRTKPDGANTQNEYGITIVQPIEKSTLKSAKQKILDAKILQTKALIFQKENELKGEVRQRAYLYTIASQMSDKAEEALVLAKTFRQKGEKRFAQGALSKADLLKLTVEEEKIAQEVQSAQIKRDSAKYFLIASARLNSSADITPIKLPILTPVDLPSGIDTLPMIAYYKGVNEEYRAQKEVAIESVIPGFKAGIGVSQLYDQHSITASLSMPIPIYHRNELLLKSIESKISENSLREQSYRYETDQKLLRQQKMLSSLSSLIVSQQHIIDQASKMVSLSQRSYEEGYGTLLELIDARRVLVAHQHEILNNLEIYYDTLGEMQKTFPPLKEKQ
ncbi:MAG: TolC family protein [Campylobacterales bacterium]|nr:TolC family protein [Campylobacterales bacterium]